MIGRLDEVENDFNMLGRWKKIIDADNITGSRSLSRTVKPRENNCSIFWTVISLWSI